MTPTIRTSRVRPLRSTDGKAPDGEGSGPPRKASATFFPYS